MSGNSKIMLKYQKISIHKTVYLYVPGLIGVILANLMIAGSAAIEPSNF